MINWEDLQQKIGDKTQIALNEVSFLSCVFVLFFLLFKDCFNAAIYFALFLTDIEMVLFGIPYFAEMSLLWWFCKSFKDRSLSP